MPCVLLLLLFNFLDRTLLTGHRHLLTTQQLHVRIKISWNIHIYIIIYIYFNIQCHIFTRNHKIQFISKYNIYKMAIYVCWFKSGVALYTDEVPQLSPLPFSTIQRKLPLQVIPPLPPTLWAFILKNITNTQIWLHNSQSWPVVTWWPQENAVDTTRKHGEDSSPIWLVRRRS